QPCAKGSFSGTGAYNCTFCGPGFYADEVCLQACKPCPSGAFSNSSNTENCTVCERGKRQPAAGATICDVCPQGTFTDTTGSLDCKAVSCGLVCVCVC